MAPTIATARKEAYPPMPDDAAPDFSIPRHTDYLAGYMDAVGRVLSTGDVRYALTARRLEAGHAPASMLGTEPEAQTPIADWSHEFDRLVENLLVLDPRDTLAFHLIDLINWYNAYTQGAQCHRLDCAPLDATTIQQAIYLLHLQGDEQVLIIATRTRKHGGY